MTHVYHSGIDYFTSPPDKPARTDLKCVACGTKLKGIKGIGYHSWAAAMGKHKTEMYDYHCPHTPKNGHAHLVELIEESEELVSKRLKKIVENEIALERKKFRKILREA